MHYGCTCGDEMAWDVTDNLPNKAYFLPDEDVGHALDALWAGVAEFIEARERGEQEQYLTYNAGVFRNLSVRDLLHQLFLSPTVEFGRRMYECEHCGRIMLQAVPDKDDWVYYYPESTKRGILSHEAAREGTDGELAATSESWGSHRQRWEYKNEWIPVGQRGADVLNSFGDEGWEVIDMTPTFSDVSREPADPSAVLRPFMGMVHSGYSVALKRRRL
jgi:hypothetical protein